MIDEQLLEAKRAALRLLQIKDYSRQELHTKLAAQGFSLEVIQQTLDWLAEHRWQSDQRLSERLQERLTEEEPSGWRRIETEFQRRGLSPPMELLDLEAERNRAVEALQKRFGAPPEGWEPKHLNRWFQFLLRRGFEPEIAQSALQHWNPRLLDESGNGSP